MTARIGSDETNVNRDLEAKTRVLEKQLDLRNQALAVLNRRLNHLEQADHAIAGVHRAREQLTAPADPGAAAEEIMWLRGANAELEAELARIRATKLFRWSYPARRVYGRMRGLP